MAAVESGQDIEIVGWELVERHPAEAGQFEVALRPVTGAADGSAAQEPSPPIVGRYHPPIDGSAPADGWPGVLWVGGVASGIDGPADAMYRRVATALAREGVASLRLAPRAPRQLEASIVDAIVGIGYLRDEGADEIGLVGHGAGGAVAIITGAMLEGIATVVTLATQAYGTDLATELAPASLLLVHGTDDRELPPAGSHDVRDRARTRAELRLVPGAGHDFEGHEADAQSIVRTWLEAELIQASDASRSAP